MARIILNYLQISCIGCQKLGGATKVTKYYKEKKRSIPFLTQNRNKEDTGEKKE